MSCRVVINKSKQTNSSSLKAGMTYHVDLHVIVDAEISVKKRHGISHQLKDHLRKEIPNLGQVLIYIEPNK